MNDTLPILDYGEIAGHTVIVMALFYGGIALYRRISDALRVEALRARIAELREQHSSKQ